MKSLSQHLKPLSHDDLMDTAERAGVTPRVAMRARKGIPVSSDNCFRLCLASGFDPVAEKPIRPRVAGGFDHARLALAVQRQRELAGEPMRLAASVMGVPLVALCRIGKAQPVQIKTTLKACEYVGVHPFDFVKCFTKHNRWDSLNPKADWRWRKRSSSAPRAA